MEIKYQDGSFITFEWENNKIRVTIQGRHLGKEIKYTSLSGLIENEQIIQLIKYLEGKHEG